MSYMTQLFVFTPSTSAKKQLETLFLSRKNTPKELSTNAHETYETADLKIVNLSEDGGTFEPLKIEHVRDLQLEVTYPPIDHDLRVILIGNLELASLPAQHALLKLLEEPPEYLQVIVTSTEPTSLLPTILSRCQVVRIHQDEASAPQQLPSQLIAALDALPTKTLSLKTTFALSDTFKERPDALDFIERLTTFIHDSVRYPSPELTQLIQKCLQARDHLKQNVNPRLVVEEVLFEMVKKER